MPIPMATMPTIRTILSCCWCFVSCRVYLICCCKMGSEAQYFVLVVFRLFLLLSYCYNIIATKSSMILYSKLNRMELYLYWYWYSLLHICRTNSWRTDGHQRILEYLKPSPMKSKTGRNWLLSKVRVGAHFSVISSGDFEIDSNDGSTEVPKSPNPMPVLHTCTGRS